MSGNMLVSDTEAKVCTPRVQFLKKAALPWVYCTQPIGARLASSTCHRFCIWESTPNSTTWASHGRTGGPAVAQVRTELLEEPRLQQFVFQFVKGYELFESMESNPLTITRVNRGHLHCFWRAVSCCGAALPASHCTCAAAVGCSCYLCQL
jgi:hypothetical protein